MSILSIQLAHESRNLMRLQQMQNAGVTADRNSLAQLAVVQLNNLQIIFPLGAGTRSPYTIVLNLQRFCTLLPPGLI